MKPEIRKSENNGKVEHEVEYVASMAVASVLGVKNSLLVRPDNDLVRLMLLRNRFLITRESAALERETGLTVNSSTFRVV